MHLVLSNLEGVFSSGRGRDERDTQLLVDHQTKDTHLCSTSLIQFDGALTGLGGFIKGIPAKVDYSRRMARVCERVDSGSQLSLTVVVSQIARELATNKITHDEDFQGTNEGK